MRANGLRHDQLGRRARARPEVGLRVDRPRNGRHVLPGPFSAGRYQVGPASRPCRGQCASWCRRTRDRRPHPHPPAASPTFPLIGLAARSSRRKDAIEDSIGRRVTSFCYPLRRLRRRACRHGAFRRVHRGPDGRSVPHEPAIRPLPHGDDRPRVPAPGRWSPDPPTGPLTSTGDGIVAQLGPPRAADCSRRRARAARRVSPLGPQLGDRRKRKGLGSAFVSVLDEATPDKRRRVRDQRRTGDRTARGCVSERSSTGGVDWAALLVEGSAIPAGPETHRSGLGRSRPGWPVLCGSSCPCALDSGQQRPVADRNSDTAFLGLLWVGG